MGWTFGYGFDRMDAANEATAGFETETAKVECVKRVFRGNVCYALMRATPKNGEPEQRYGLVVLLAKDGRNWGYKDMDETMFPFYYDFPVSWLDELTELENDSSRRWREAVRRTAAEKAERRAMLRNAKRGDRIVLRSGYSAGGAREGVVARRDGRRLYCRFNGALARVPAKAIGSIEPAAREGQ